MPAAESTASYTLKWCPVIDGEPCRKVERTYITTDPAKVGTMAQFVAAFAVTGIDYALTLSREATS